MTALNSAFTFTSSNKPESASTKNLVLDKAIKDLEKKLQASSIRKGVLVGQNLAWHQAVLGFLKIQISRYSGETQEQMALYIARSHGRGLCFSRKIIAWERSWLSGREIEEGRKGCYSKTKSWGVG